MDLTQWIIFVIFVSKTVGEKSFKGCLKENTYGYPYLKFFPVLLLSKTPPKGLGPQETNDYHYFEFYVKSQSNAHIFLGESKTLGYEIILGARNNTISQIRFIHGLSKKSKETVKTEGIVSDKEHRGFWVEHDRYGRIMVGTMNSTYPILKYRDQYDILINTVSFSTWANVLGKWHFACNNTYAPEISDEDEDQNLTANQRLRNDLLAHYNPSNFPEKDGETENVELHLEPNYLHLSENSGQLEIGGVAYLKWRDWKLAWNETYYDNIGVINVIPGEIWTPTIYVMNSIAFEEKSLLSRRRTAFITSDGIVTLRTQFHSITYCVLGLKNWPLDVHECSLQLGFLTEPIDIHLKSMILSKVSHFKWELKVINNTYIDKYYNIEIRFRRRDEPIIRILMISSFLSAAALSLLSFLLSFENNPNSSVKLVFNCLSLFILILMAINLADDLPIALSPVPKIVLFYSWSIVAMCIPILLFIALRYIPPNIQLPRFLSKLLNSNIAHILCFPSTTPEMKSQNGKNANDSARLCILIERLVLLVYFTTLVVPFVINFTTLENFF